jgi:hypothetical protein
MGVRWRADVQRERHPPGNDVGCPRQRGDGADGADQARLVGLAERLDRNDAFGGARQRVAPEIAVTTPTGRFCCSSTGPCSI